jgi:hypothetical protein
LKYGGLFEKSFSGRQPVEREIHLNLLTQIKGKLSGLKKKLRWATRQKTVSS